MGLKSRVCDPTQAMFADGFGNYSNVCGCVFVALMTKARYACLMASHCETGMGPGGPFLFGFRGGGGNKPMGGGSLLFFFWVFFYQGLKVGLFVGRLVTLYTCPRRRVGLVSNG